MARQSTTLLDARALERTIKRMADEIVELNGGVEGLILGGIQRLQLSRQQSQLGIDLGLFAGALLLGFAALGRDRLNGLGDQS